MTGWSRAAADEGNERVRRVTEIHDRIGELFNGDFRHQRRDVLGWASTLLVSHTLDEALGVIRTCARLCLNEAIIRHERGEDGCVHQADAKLTEYLWLLEFDLAEWFHTEPGEPRFRVAADLLGVPLPVG